MIPIRLEVYLKRHKNVQLVVFPDGYIDWFNTELVDLETGKQILVGSGKCMEDSIIDISNKLTDDQI